MADSAITFLVNQLAALLQEGVELLADIREEVQYIKDELERMKAFLKVSDSMEETDPELEVWVKQVRDVVYDTEDVLDEFILRLSCHHANGVHCTLRKILQYVKTLKARHQIASKIRRIKSRVISIAEGQRRYHYKPNISRPVSSSYTAVNRQWYDCRGDALLLEETELVGIVKPKQQLVEWLRDSNSSLKVISVVGMGGLGKTVLAKKVYEDVEVRGRFQSHAWLTVSQCFNLTELLKDLLQQLYDEMRQPIPHRLDTWDENRLKGLIKNFLQQSKYLLVLDEVWSIGAWDAIKYALPDSNSGSRVLLTTRLFDVASITSSESQGNIYALEALSPEDSWTLFCKKTFYDNCCPPHLTELSECILRKCKGLPLAIVAISGVLALKDKSRKDEWQMIQRCLRAELENSDRLLSTTKVLLLSYNDLPYYLKSCFLYMSIFPEDHLIEQIRLIRLWIAEGFVEAKVGKTLEEVAESYLNDLINRSLIQVAGTTVDGRVRTCRIHDLLLEIILSKSTDQNFVLIANEQSTGRPDKVRHLSIQNSLVDVQESRNLNRLRSLFMFGVADPLSKSSMPILFNGGSRLFKVLDLRGASLETFPDEVVKLFHLRYLSLRSTKVKMVPKSIGNLQNLETLDLKDTFVTELPAEIWKLHKLRHLLVYRYNVQLYAPFHSVDGFKFTAKLGGFLSLQKLSCIEAHHGGTRMIRELEKLKQLRRLGIIKLRREDGVVLCTSIEKMSSLRSLSVTSVEEDEILDLQTMHSAPPFLQRLYLAGRLEKLPSWIPSIHSLVRLSLRWSQLRDDPIQPLQHMPNLVYLTLLQTYDGEELCFEAGGFQKLKVLLIVRMKRLRRVKIVQGALPNLEELYIRNCKALDGVPAGIEHLTELKNFELGDMPDELIAKLNRERPGGDYSRIAHISKIWVGHLSDGTWTGYHL